jgi:hypothetical protein
MQKINFLELNFKSKIKLQNDSWNYLSSEAGIKEGNRINDYYEMFIKPYQYKNCDILPDINPWEFTIFKTTKKTLDFYYTNARIDRGFFISDKTKNILKE